MVSDEFALEQFRKNYGHMFTEVKLRRLSDGGAEIVASYVKPRMKLDWVPKRFCRRPVRCVRVATKQPSTPTPKASAKA